jgi:hypothetical protein
MASTTAAADRTGEKPKRDNGRRKVFITSSRPEDAKALGATLDHLGIDWFTLDDVDLPGRNLLEVLLACIERADVVLAVLDASPKSRNVFFQLGVAQGLKKRTLALVEGEELLPSVISFGTPYLRTRADNSKAVEFALTQLLAAPPHSGKAPEEAVTRTRPLGKRADELLARLRDKEGSMREEDLIEILRQAIEASGVTAVSSATLKGARTDLAVWSEDLEPWVHNPLIIEVRKTLRGQADVDQVVGGVRRFMEATKVPWAMVIYGNTSARTADRLRFPNILVISAEDFLESLRTAGFGDIVRRLRNTSVHGAS